MLTADIVLEIKALEFCDLLDKAVSNDLIAAIQNNIFDQDIEEFEQSSINSRDAADLIIEIYRSRHNN